MIEIVTDRDKSEASRARPFLRRELKHQYAGIGFVTNAKILEGKKKIFGKGLRKATRGPLEISVANLFDLRGLGPPQ